MNENSLLCRRWADLLDGILKWSRGRTVVVQGERYQRSLTIRTEKGCEGKRHWACEQIFVLKHCLPPKTFIPNCVACSVVLGIILHLQDVDLGHFGKRRVYTDHCSIFSSREVDFEQSFIEVEMNN